ncbi:IclR family transcriptional regulator [Paenibacillus solisilvae]|uniref:IclR family transcriptional regulator n=1 Tax=Paenibacillus solisilvae TaxID=2486751 RepID=A0ABW0VZD9_9BACL
MNKRESKSQVIPNVDRAFNILELLCESPEGVRFIDIYEQLNLAKSSAFVLLENLEMKGYVEKTPDGRFRATLRLFQLGSKVLNNLDIRAIALPYMTALRDETVFPVHLAMLDGPDIVYLEKVESSGFIKFDTYVGKRAPVHLTAVGKAIAAFLNEDQLDDIIASRGLGGGTDKAVTTKTEFKTVLETVRELGYSIEDEEEVHGIRCIGAPIRNHTGKVAASISIIGLHRELPATRIPEFGKKVIETANRISSALGYKTLPAEAAFKA